MLQTLMLALVLGSAPQPATINVTEALAIGPFEYGGRTPFSADPVQSALARGTWKAPNAGDSLAGKTWETIRVGRDGWFNGPQLESGYLLAEVDSPVDRTMVLEAAGHGMVTVNGEPRAGDVYKTEYVRLPVQLRRGENQLLFSAGRGFLHVRLVEAPSRPVVEARDATLPDLVAGEKRGQWGAAIVMNPTASVVRGLHLRASIGDAHVETGIKPLPPMTTMKVPFRIPGGAWKAGDGLKLKLELVGKSSAVTFDMPVKAKSERHKRTYISSVDGSVQYYGVLPAQPKPGENARALVLSVHGASVEAIGQAGAYEPKTWANIVAPTNRRPYGFDWEDWGRVEAMETLADAEAYYKPAKDRIYLTGHSMGGHGTWYLGACYPDRWAAIAPSAGWISFFTYAGGVAQPGGASVEQVLARANNVSDTKQLVRNYKLEGVYVLHGDADDNVPVTEAREMRRLLSPFHRDVDWFEQPGAGHWWDASDEPGTDCVDWAPMFDFFARHRLPESREVRELEFATVSPGISATCHWAGIDMQERSLEVSRVKLRCDPGMRRFLGTTENVARLRLNVAHLSAGAPLNLSIDGTKLDKVAWPKDKELRLEKADGQWRLAGTWSPDDKTPARCGPFKEAFGRNMIFVYGTSGTFEETALNYAKARYDSECWWYRGNGTVEMIADRDFSDKATRNRSVIVYGNADTNSAWRLLLGSSPVQVRRGSVSVGGRLLTGDDLACLLVRPRPGSAVASVGVVSSTGALGARASFRTPYLSAGIHLPDVTVFGADVLEKGPSGVRVAGFFGPDWSVEKGDFAWR